MHFSNSSKEVVSVQEPFLAIIEEEVSIKTQQKKHETF